VYVKIFIAFLWSSAPLGKRNRSHLWTLLGVKYLMKVKWSKEFNFFLLSFSCWKRSVLCEITECGWHGKRSKFSYWEERQVALISRSSWFLNDFVGMPVLVSLTWLYWLFKYAPLRDWSVHAYAQNFLCAVCCSVSYGCRMFYFFKECFLLSLISSWILFWRMNLIRNQLLKTSTVNWPQFSEGVCLIASNLRTKTFRD